MGRVGPAGAAWSRSCAGTGAAPTGCAQPEPGLPALSSHTAQSSCLRSSRVRALLSNPCTGDAGWCGKIQGEPFLHIR